MPSSFIDIKRLTDEELSGVVNLYPWFASARKELCMRMSRRNCEWAHEILADSTLYITDRGVLATIVRALRGNRAALRQMAAEDTVAGPPVETVPQETAPAAPERPLPEAARRVVVVGGDYFSRGEYDSASDGGFKSLVDTLTHRAPRTEVADAASLGQFDIPDFEDKEEFYTETLAEIYVEQGYIDQARKIYSKLSLEYPEKSVYFASLIDNLN